MCIKELTAAGALAQGHFAELDGTCTRWRAVMPRLYQHPDLMQPIMRRLAAHYQGQAIDAVAAAGEDSAIPAYELARTLNAQYLCIQRRNNTMTLRREMHIDRGERVLIVRDVIASAQAVRESVELLRALGAQIAGIASLADLSGGSAHFRFPFYALVSVDGTRRPRSQCPLCREHMPFTAWP